MGKPKPDAKRAFVFEAIFDLRNIDLEVFEGRIPSFSGMDIAAIAEVKVMDFHRLGKNQEA